MENEENEENNYTQFRIRDGIIFLIELSPEITVPLKELNYKSQLYEILSSINDLMSEMIITLPSTGVGIYFYNCAQSTTIKMMNIPGFAKLFSLDDLNARNMKLLNDIIMEHDAQLNLIESKISFAPQENTEQLPIIMQMILDELQRKEDYHFKKLVWFTGNDKPFSRQSTKENIWRVVNDYDNYGYLINPIFLDRFRDPEQQDKISFDMEAFQDIFMNTGYLKKKPEYSTKDTVYRQMAKNSKRFKSTLLSKGIRSAILRLKEIRRIVFSCNLILGDGEESTLGCSVKGYTLFKHETLNTFGHVYTKDEFPKTVHTKSRLVNERTQEEIEIDDNIERPWADRKDEANIRKGYTLSGGEVLYLNRKQVEFLKNYVFDHSYDTSKAAESSSSHSSPDAIFDESDNESEEGKHSELLYSSPPYLKLLGFRSFNKLDTTYNSSAPIFVTPDLEDGERMESGGYTNSFSTMSALYQSCLRLRKFGVVFGCLHKNSLPCLYALYPTRAEFSSRYCRHVKEFPDGFLLIRLPWLDDIRSLPGHVIQNSHMLQSDHLPEQVIKGLTELFSGQLLDEYSPSDYPNPSLNYFYKIIKQTLLQIESSDASKDLASNDVTVKRLSEVRDSVQNDILHSTIMKNINNFLSHDEEINSNEAIAVPEPSKKKQKVDPVDESTVQSAWQNDQWNHITVAQLKEFVKGHNGRIKSAAKRQDLIDNISLYFSGKENNQ